MILTLNIFFSSHFSISHMRHSLFYKNHTSSRPAFHMAFANRIDLDSFFNNGPLASNMNSSMFFKCVFISSFSIPLRTSQHFTFYAISFFLSLRTDL